MVMKERVKITLKKAGYGIKVIVTTLQRAMAKPEDETWVRNLEIATRYIEFELNREVAELLAKGALMDVLADATVSQKSD